VIESDVIVALNVTVPCVTDRTVKVVAPLASDVPLAGWIVMPDRAGFAVSVTVLPGTGPLEAFLSVAVIVAVVTLSAGSRMQVVVSVEFDVLIAPPTVDVAVPAAAVAVAEVVEVNVTVAVPVMITVPWELVAVACSV